MCDYFETFQEEDMIAENNYIVCSPLLSEKERQATVKMEEEKAEGKIVLDFLLIISPVIIELNGIRLIDFDKSKCTSPMQCSINEGDWVPVAYKQRVRKKKPIINNLRRKAQKRKNKRNSSLLCLNNLKKEAQSLKTSSPNTSGRKTIICTF